MFCAHCGSEVGNNEKFCKHCGAPIEVEKTNHYERVEAETVDYDNSNNNKSEYVYTDPGEKTMAIVAYITWIGFIVALVSQQKDSPLVKHHLNQSLIINLAALIGVFVPHIGSVINLIAFVYAIVGIISASNGEMKSLPLLENIKLI